MEAHLRERYKDLALIVVLAIIGICGFFLINLEESEVYPGPGGLSWRSLPFIYSGILLALVAIFAASTLLDIALLKKGHAAKSFLGAITPQSANRVTTLRRIAVFVGIIAYAWGLGAFGFALSTPVLLFVMFFVLGRMNFMENLVLAILGSLLMWCLFVGFLKLPISGDLWDPVTPVLNSLWKMTGLR